ncbi:MAG: YbaK/EbsC family protein [Lachnospiraceae bacterium]|nr:YbaK/EbsC family protein [Lachnospiraceae bacterium]
MSFDKVKQFFEEQGAGDKVLWLEHSSATVELAAEAVGCEPARIAKTLSFLVEDRPILILTAGDVKIDNKKYKELFHAKAKMIPGDLVEELVGHAPGGVCPFVIKDGIDVYLDASLKRFDIVYPAAGSGNSAVRLTIPELEHFSSFKEWIDICKER